MSHILVECNQILQKRLLKAMVFTFVSQFCVLAFLLLAFRLENLNSSTLWLFAALVFFETFYGIKISAQLWNERKYCGTRFYWAVENAPHKSKLFCLQIIVGVLSALLFLRCFPADYGNFIILCNSIPYINSRFMFLLSAGVFATIYHFFKENIFKEPVLNFSNTNENPIVKLCTVAYQLIFSSKLWSFTPVFCFTFGYWLLQNMDHGVMRFIWKLEVDESLQNLSTIIFDWRLLGFIWLLFTQVISNFHIMEQLFSVFLTMPIELNFEENNFPKCDLGFKLAEALAVRKFPAIKLLAARQLYQISTQPAVVRRRKLKELVRICKICFYAVIELTEEIAHETNLIFGSKQFSARKRWFLNRNYKASKILIWDEETIKESQPEPYVIRLEITLKENITIPRLHDFLFAEKVEKKLAFLLENSESNAWIINALGNIIVTSVKEDLYGIIEIEVMAIIKVLLILKEELDQLDNICSIKDNPNLFNLKSVVKRCLYQISQVYADNPQNIVVDPEDMNELHSMSYLWD